MITIPSPNPIINSAVVSFNYIISSNTIARQVTSNSVATQVNIATLNLNKISDKNYVKLGDTITYTIVVKNIGNIAATAIFLQDTIPKGVLYKSGTLKVNQLPVGGDLNLGITIPNIPAYSSSTVTFIVDVVSIINPNLIENQASTKFSFLVDPSLPYSSAEAISNTTTGYMNNAVINVSDGGFNKYVTPKYADKGDTITYTITLTNTGTVAANNVTLIDTTPNGTTFIPGSVYLNGTQQPTGNPNPPTGVLVGTIGPRSTSTVTFKVLVYTIPTINPIANGAAVNFKYIVDPSLPEVTGTGISPIVTTEVNNASINISDGGFNKYVTPKYANKGDTITYTITLTNTGNTAANNVTLIDTTPNGTTFIPGSVYLNGTQQPTGNPNPPTGVVVGTIGPGSTSTVTFKVLVYTIPTINPIANGAAVNFKFIVDPSLPAVTGTGISPIVTTQVNNANCEITKTAIPAYAKIGDTITYTVVVSNKGTVNAVNTVVIDTIPQNTTFINNSLKLNGVSQPSTTIIPPTGFTLGVVAPAQIHTITFDVLVVSLPAGNTNTISNTVYTGYNYTTDPSIPNGNHGGNLTTGGEVNINMAIIDKNKGYIKYTNKIFTPIYTNVKYTIVVKNSGNVSATQVTLLDTLPNDISFVAGTVFVNNINLPGSNPTIAPGIVIGEILAGATATVTFEVFTATIPSPNPFTNTAKINYKYTSNPNNVNGESGEGLSNEVTTKVNGAFFARFNENFPKVVNGRQSVYTTVGETLVYTMSFKNLGNVSAQNVKFIDTIPQGTTFITNSVTIDGVTIPGVNPAPPNGILLGTILPAQNTTLTFQVKVDSIPTTTIVSNRAILKYNFTGDPLNPDGESGQNNSSEAVAQINYALIDKDGFKKYQNSNYAEIGDTIQYTLVLKNIGVSKANSVMVYDTVPVGTVYIPGSVTVNGIPTSGNPETGINLGDMPIQAPITITFGVLVVSIPGNRQLNNTARVNYSWIVDPTIGNTASNISYSNTTSSEVKHAEIISNKVSMPAYADLGSTITYSIILKNTGNVPALNISILDTIPSNLIFVNDTLMVDGVIKPGANPTTWYNVGNVMPNVTMTVNFKALVITLPTINPIKNIVLGKFNYVVDPSLPERVSTFSTISNGTIINNANFNLNNGGFKKYASRMYVTLGDTITYTLVLTNKGNVPAQNIILVDTAPKGTTYINGTVLINSVPSSENIQMGVFIGSISPSHTTTVSYSVLVTTITDNYSINNTANVNYKYEVDPTKPLVNGVNNSTTITSAEKLPIVTITSTVDKNKVTIGEQVVYEVIISNTGNVSAKDIIVCVTLNSGLAYVPNSTVIGGVSKPSENLIKCVTIPNLGPNTTFTVSFVAEVVSIPRGCIVINGINVNYNYIVDPSLPPIHGSAKGITQPIIACYQFDNTKILSVNNQCSGTNIGCSSLKNCISSCGCLDCIRPIVNPKLYKVFGICSSEDYVCVNQAIIKYNMWQEHNVKASIDLPEDIMDIESIEAKLVLLRSDKVITPNTEGCSNLEGKELTGHKQIIEVLIKYTIKYVSITGCICSEEYCRMISSYIVLNPKYSNSKLEVRNCIEDITITRLCKNKLDLSTAILLYLTEKDTTDLDCSGLNESCCSCIANSNVCSNIASFIKPCDKYWNEFNVFEQICTSKKDIGEIVSVTGFISAIEFDNVNTPVSRRASNEGLLVTGNMLLVLFDINLKVTYVSIECENMLKQVNVIIPASSYIIVDSSINSNLCSTNRYNVKVCIEDLFICNLDRSSLFTNSTILIKATLATNFPQNCIR